MILPDEEKCRKVLNEMAESEFWNQLNDFEKRFVSSNRRRIQFTTAQKTVINDFINKYQFASV